MKRRAIDRLLRDAAKRAKPADPLDTLPLFDDGELVDTGGRAVDESDTPRARREKRDTRLVRCARCGADVLPGPHTLPDIATLCRSDIA